MGKADVVAAGRVAFDRGAWREAFALLSEAERRDPLAPDDLQLLGAAAYLLGQTSTSEEVMARAHQAWLASGGTANAVRCAFWVSFSMLDRGDVGPGSGWLARASRLLDEHKLDCVEQGYLLVPLGLQSIDGGDAASAYATFVQVATFAEQYRDPDLLALARLGSGVALLRLGETGAGMAQFDEAMVAVSIGEVSPIIAGIVYCGVIQQCYDAFDLRRAQEWTIALTRWCEEHPDLVPFRGQCLVHRSQLLQLRGSWAEAMEEIRHARRRLETPPGQPALGMAMYQQAELHRLRGEFTQAETAYRQAADIGHDPQPGMALLQLAQRRGDAAEVAIRICLDQTASRVARPPLLGAYVEIALAVGDVAAARTAADELADIAVGLSMPALDALAARATAAVLLAQNQAGPALAALRRSGEVWRDLQAPYELARIRELVGLAHQSLGDMATAQVNLDAARQVFDRLGAVTDLARVRATGPVASGTAAGRLTAREAQVLGLVAVGNSNRDIAGHLLISEHTVARHLQNIFAKLGLSSRTAASAYAYEHGLAGPPHGQNRPGPVGM